MAGLVWALPLHPAAADHEWYEIPSHANWDHGDLTVLIVPPVHGQLYNLETEALNGGDPNELTPFNSYLEAIEASIAAWDAGINTLGADWLKEYYEPSVYVLGRDDVPQEVLTAPDILVVTDENEGPFLGMSAWGKTGYVHTPCIVRMSSSYLLSFTYADMFNIAAQEYGHCLGLNHVGSQGGVDPTSDVKHPEHDVMNGYYPHEAGFPDTHLHCISNLDVLGLEHVFDYKMDYSAALNLGVEGLTQMPAFVYGDTCAPPPSDWREIAGPTGTPGAAAMNTTIKQPLDGAKFAVNKFKRAVGTVYVDQSLEEVPYEVEVALARIGRDGSCEWWDQDGDAFRLRDCYSPTWKTTELDGLDRWTWRTPKGLPPGSYRAVVRVVTPYGNEPVEDDGTAEFSLLRASRRS
jgi:hypothetical protein